MEHKATDHEWELSPIIDLCPLGFHMLQVNIEPDVAEAQQSSMSGLPSFLIAGVPQQVAITARDAQGNLTAGADKVEVLVDSVTEGGLCCWSHNCHSKVACSHATQKRL